MEGAVVMLFGPEPDNVATHRSRSKRYDRAIGLLWFLGTAGAIVALIYLVSFLD
jgi:hypothetical protein